jgi:oligoribonuclease
VSQKDHWLLVADVETTGLDAEQDFLLEIAALVVDEDLNVVDKFHSLVTEAASMLAIESRLALEPKVRAMHEKSGLLQELREEYQKPHRTTAPNEVELRALEFCMRAGGSPGRMQMVGYTVQFDQRVIQRALPLLGWVCSYQIIEVGSARRIFNLAGFAFKKREVPGDRAHRALDDAVSSLEELKSLRDHARIAYRFSTAEQA